MRGDITVHMRRLTAVRRAVERQGLDGAIISDPDNRFYVSGYRVDDHGPTEVAGVVLIGPSVAEVWTSPNNVAWAASEATDFDARAWQRPWEHSIADRILELQWALTGFEAESMTHASWQRLTDRLGDVALAPLDDSIDRLRWIKDERELRVLQRAIDITDDAMTHISAWMRAGMTEREVAIEAESTFLRLGADGVAFPPTVGSGPNASRPHHRSGDRAVREGEPIVIDIGASVDGYAGDLTRTLWLGALDARVQAAYDTVHKAQQAALETVRPGIPAKEVDLAARAVIEDAGLQELIVHSVGHGLGIRVHDGPSVNRTADLPLEAGHVVTIEPGLYEDGVFGVRIEDVVAVTEDGCRVLSRAAKAPVGRR
jgi:Xaa-Pro aminopeptidase